MNLSLFGSTVELPEGLPRQGEVALQLAVRGEAMEAEERVTLQQSKKELYVIHLGLVCLIWAVVLMNRGLALASTVRTSLRPCAQRSLQSP